MSEADATLKRVAAATVALLQDEAAMGGAGIPIVARPAALPTVRAVEKVPLQVEGGLARLHVLAEQAAGCTRCSLHAGRTKSVFARGSERAEIVFVGEGPGRDEDASGQPFVGAAGQLLDKMIVAMGYGREDVYVCNVVKCRPPENRTPLPNEAAACEPFLTEQLLTVGPKVIVALGKCASINLGVATETGPWRGVWKEWRGVPVMPTYHPAFLLRSPEHKRDVWEDLQRVMTRLGRPLPGKPKG